MIYSKVKYLVVRSIALLLLVTFVNSTINAGNAIPADYELKVKVRLKSMDCVVIPRLNEDVKFFLGNYIFKHPKYTERMLGNAALYFPVFDRILREKNLPSSLKALSILESWLDLGATSRVGAGGLWQLMPQTARMYGLTVNNQVDERRDIYRSTEAALTLLSRLYEIYQDWGIALAAYNAGPMRVNRAIEKAGGEANSFWTIAPYLPKETQQFIPKFIALTYLINFYAEHEIFPTFPELDLQFINYIKVYQSLNFQDITKVTGLDMSTIKSLNPAYKQTSIPASKSGFNLVLPERVIPQMEEYLNITDRSERTVFISDLKKSSAEVNTFDELKVNYIESSHIVKEGETLQSIANYYNVNVTRLSLWNHLSSTDIDPGMELIVHLPLEKYMENRKRYATNTIQVVPSIDLGLLIAELKKPDPFVPTLPTQFSIEKYHVHILQGGESLWDICLKYEIDNLQDLFQMNRTADLATFKPGTVINVRRQGGENSSNSILTAMK